MKTTPQIGDFVKIYGYTDFKGDTFEVGRVVQSLDGGFAACGIAQNNPEWKYTEFEIGLQKNGKNLFTFELLKGESQIVNCKVWRAVWKKHKHVWADGETDSFECCKLCGHIKE